MKDIDDTWNKLTEMSKEELESYLAINPKTGKPDGLYTLLLAGTEPKNLEYVSKRDNISLETARQRLSKLFSENNYDIPLSLLN